MHERYISYSYPGEGVVNINQKHSASVENYPKNHKYDEEKYGDDDVFEEGFKDMGIPELIYFIVEGVADVGASELSSENFRADVVSEFLLIVFLEFLPNGEVYSEGDCQEDAFGLVGSEEDDSAEYGLEDEYDGVGCYYYDKVDYEIDLEGNLQTHVVAEVVPDNVCFCEEGGYRPAVSDVLAINTAFHLLGASLSLQLEVVGEGQDIEAHICKDVEFEFGFECEEGQFYFFHLEEEVEFAIGGYLLGFVEEDGLESLEISCSSVLLAGNQKLLKHFWGLNSAKAVVVRQSLHAIIELFPLLIVVI